MEASTSVAPSTGRVNLALGLGAVALLVGLALGIVAIQKGSQNLEKIHRLEAQVRVLRARTGGAQANVTTRVTTLEQKLGSLETTTKASSKKQTSTEATVKKLTSCVPELQSQIGGLEIAGETYALSYIKNSTNVSHECQPILYGTSSK